jgi:hypothetical protein
MNGCVDRDPHLDIQSFKLPEQYQTSPFFIVSMDLQQIMYYY